VTSGDRARAIEELERLAPAELLVDPGLSVADDLATLSADPMVSRHDPAAFGREAAADRLARYDAASLSDATAAERRAVGALLAYGEYTQGDDGPLSYVSRIVRDDPREALRLDAAAVRSLELFESRGDRSGTALTDVVDRTVTAPGRRRLAAWLRRPLVDRAAIEARHGAVAALRDAALVRADLRATLGDVYDVERLVSRVSRGRANARDLRSLLGSLDRVPELRESLADLLADRDAAYLADVRDRLDDLADVRDLLREAIAPDPPQELTEGGVIREGFSAELDDLRATEREGREWVADLEERERERTGIDSLSVGHTQVHGYYIEVTNPNLDRVPDDYTRRQTLKNAERFYTPELKRREDEIVGAAERADAMEYDLFREVRADVAEETERIQRVADALADVDAVTSFATVAAEHDYCRPAMRDGRGIDVEAGRHPVVERTVEFVANDVHLGPGELALVTGPNMAGKSTYMRQAALICVLAQAGSFVPADDARLPVVDRVFTRVGASDDIAGGQSTFMREMTELTEILREATPDSLVLLDEVGRGTATTDGRAIARAAAEFVHDEVRAHTLFATHYHELTSLADGRERLRNLHFGAERVDRGDDGDDGAVTFLHRVVDGPASSSYGIEVARMAGVPAAVVDRARELVAGRDDDGGVRTPTLAAYADGEASDDGAATPTHGGVATAAATNGERGRDRDRAGDADRDAADDLAAAIRDVDVAGTTPLEALNLLADLRRRVDDGRD
jgi:DNA mismatch repair protein MutS